jgi:hypothetical protein
MPVTYEIDKKQGVIRTRCIGFVTLAEVTDHFRALEQDADCPSRLDVVLDLRETRSLPTSDQLRAVSEEIGRIRGKVQFGACAFVVHTDPLFGTAMVLEVFAAKRFRVTKIFRELAEAETWLALQRSMVN